jgi:hypothetical protein
MIFLHVCVHSRARPARCPCFSSAFPFPHSGVCCYLQSELRTCLGSLPATHNGRLWTENQDRVNTPATSVWVAGLTLNSHRGHSDLGHVHVCVLRTCTRVHTHSQDTNDTHTYHIPHTHTHKAHTNKTHNHKTHTPHHTPTHTHHTSHTHTTPLAAGRY